MRTKSKIEEMLSIACIFCRQNGCFEVWKFTREYCLLFTLKNNEQQVRAPANVCLFNQTFNSFTTMATRWLFGDKVTHPGGEIDYTLVGGLMVARRLESCRPLAGSCDSRPHTFPWARKLTWQNANNEGLLTDKRYLIRSRCLVSSRNRGKECVAWRDQTIENHGCEKKKVKPLYTPKWPSGFLSMKRLGGLLFPPGWDANPSQGYTQHIFWYPIGEEKHSKS